MTTVPILGWRIDARPGDTRTAVAGMPSEPHTCTCVWCSNWRLAYGDILPDTLVTGLRRLGLDPATPDDLYRTHGSGATIGCRVTYWCLGTLQEGPATWREHDGRMRQYYPVTAALLPLMVSVADARDLHDRPPPWSEQVADAPLVQVDLRLEVPWRLDGPQSTRQ